MFWRLIFLFISTMGFCVPNTNAKTFVLPFIRYSCEYIGRAYWKERKKGKKKIRILPLSEPPPHTHTHSNTAVDPSFRWKLERQGTCKLENRSPSLGNCTIFNWLLDTYNTWFHHSLNRNNDPLIWPVRMQSNHTQKAASSVPGT